MKMVMPAKLTSLAIFQIKLCWDKSYEDIVSVHQGTNKNLLHDSNYISDVVMRPTFGNSSISVAEVIINSILQGSHQKNDFFWGFILVEVQWFGTGMTFTSYSRVEKGFKVKVRKFLGIIPTFVEVSFFTTPYWIGLI